MLTVPENISFGKNDTYVVPKGMPLEVWIDKYSRKKKDGTYQSWEERIDEVIEGNFSLDPRNSVFSSNSLQEDKALSQELGRKGIFVLSGRHLQHGDLQQKKKIGELFTNCSTALFSWVQFWLLMKGSGVGRSYDSDIHFVDWDYMPNCRFVLSSNHPDYEPWIESLEEAQHKYDTESENVRWFKVEDSAEGWVKILTVMETAAFHKNNVDNTFVFDITPVRERNKPIKGQQNRPASGPIPLIQALTQVSRIKGLNWKPWKQALFIDHYMSACVRVGGVRRSARMSTKFWKDRDIFEFIDIKRGGWLYTSNNSIMVDEEFWEQANSPKPSHGRRVFEAAIAAAYYDKTGEPGFINVDKLTWNPEGLEDITAENYLNKTMLDDMFGGLHKKTVQMTDYILEKAKKKKYSWIVNPCSEIVMAIFGAYCVVGDTCLAYAKHKQEAVDGVRMVAQALIRTNLMQFLYAAETKRTNRIGVSLIGLHEFMWNVFGITFDEAILADEEYREALIKRGEFPHSTDKTANSVWEFWEFMRELEIAIEEESIAISKVFGVTPPHTFVTMKPGGTTPKVMNCTEAANLPSMDYYLRWVQFRSDHIALDDFRRRGYPVRDISKSETRINEEGKEFIVNGYKDTSIVGFPTRMEIAKSMGDKLVTASEATFEQHFAWLRLLEKHLLGGHGKNNQISYTIKYNPKNVTYSEFMKVILDNQRSIRCCSIMPEEDSTAYIYTPEERITADQYYELISKIDLAEREAVDEASLMCAGDHCGIDFSKNASIEEELAKVG